jgi:hypothetical protein
LLGNLFLAQGFEVVVVVHCEGVVAEVHFRVIAVDTAVIVVSGLDRLT